MTLAAATVLLLGVTACEGGDDDEASGGGDAEDVCEHVWVVGETLPDDYPGQGTSSEGGREASGLSDCEDGPKFTTSDDRFYATLGGEIEAGPEGSAADQKAYDAAARAC